MVAKTDQDRLDPLKRIHNAALDLWAYGDNRLLSLTASMLELTANGNRNSDDVCFVLQAIHDGKKFHTASVEPVPAAPVVDDDLRNRLSTWQSRYLSMGIKKYFSNLRIPEKKEGFNRLIVVVQDQKISELITELKKKMKVWTYDDPENLDKVQDIVQRPKEDHAIWVRDRQEADEELKNKSADDLQSQGINTETLKERLLHEYAYFEETGQHLDLNSWTRCAGSRDPSGGVPRVRWNPGCSRVCVLWYYSNDRRSDERARRVVSL